MSQVCGTNCLSSGSHQRCEPLDLERPRVGVKSGGNIHSRDWLKYRQPALAACRFRVCPPRVITLGPSGQPLSGLEKRRMVMEGVMAELLSGERPPASIGIDESLVRLGTAWWCERKQRMAPTRTRCVPDSRVSAQGDYPGLNWTTLVRFGETPHGLGGRDGKVDGWRAESRLPAQIWKA